jgi:flavin reductase (DIM6/NTAB) family NADH-FMN oxidoreductase RutF
VFRDVVGRFASGVTIVSTRVGEQDFGTTASAFSSLSLEPPMILVCLNQTSDTGDAIRRSRFFAVSVLRQDQHELARRFAVKSESKFAGLSIERGAMGAPLFPGALAHVECRVIRATRGGTHTVFLAEALAATGSEGQPLTYFRGRFGQFEDTPRRVPIDGRSAIQALQARCAVELAVVDLALGELTEGDLLELRAHASLAQEAVACDPPDVAGLTSASVAFHERFIGLLGNSRMESFYHGLGTSSIWRQTLGAGEYISPAYLTELVDACAARDADRARRIIADHFAAATDIARTALERARTGP